MSKDLEAVDAELSPRELTDLIKHTAAGLWSLMVEAYQRAVWIDLNYGSWDDYCRGEFDTDNLRIPLGPLRSGVVEMMREAQMGTGEIASATGLSESTVRRSTSQSFDPEDDLEPEPEDTGPAAEPEPTEPTVIAAGKVERAFYSFGLMQVRFTPETVARAARADPNFATLLRDDLARTKKWMKEVEAALRKA